MSDLATALLVLTGATTPDEALKRVAEYRDRVRALEAELALAQARLDPETAQSFREALAGGNWSHGSTVNMVRKLCRRESDPQFS